MDSSKPFDWEVEKVPRKHVRNIDSSQLKPQLSGEKLV